MMDVDFTKYPPGSAVSGAGRIECCSVCGRPGERRKGTKKCAYIVVHKVSIRSVLLERSRKRVTRGIVTDECKAASVPMPPRQP